MLTCPSDSARDGVSLDGHFKLVSGHVSHVRSLYLRGAAVISTCWSVDCCDLTKTCTCHRLAPGLFPGIERPIVMPSK